MAKLNAGLLSALVVLIVLGVGVTPGNGQLVGDLFGGLTAAEARAYFGTFPKMRIISSRNRGLSLAVSGGNIVVARTSNDQTQAWIQDNEAIGKLSTEVGCRRPFALVNFDQATTTALAIVPPSKDPLGPAELAAYDPSSCVRPSMLWTQGTPNTNGFYIIQMFGDESRAFNSLGGASVGATLGVRPTKGGSANVLWRIVRF